MHLLVRSSCGAAALLLVALLLAACGGSSKRTASTPKRAAATVPMVVVPSLVGRRQEDAHRLVDQAGLQLRWTGFTGKLGNGRYNVSCVKVLTQSPAAGERRPRGSSVSVIEAACRTPNERPHGVAPDGSTEG